MRLPGPTQVVIIDDLVVQASVGVHAHESARRQPLILSVEIETEPTLEDSLSMALDYLSIVDVAETLAAGDHIALVETFAWRLARACLALPGARRANVTVRKPQAIATAMAGVRVSAETA